MGGVSCLMTIAVAGVSLACRSRRYLGDIVCWEFRPASKVYGARGGIHGLICPTGVDKVSHITFAVCVVTSKSLRTNSQSRPWFAHGARTVLALVCRWWCDTCRDKGARHLTSDEETTILAKLNSSVERRKLISRGGAPVNAAQLATFMANRRHKLRTGADCCRLILWAVVGGDAVGAVRPHGLLAAQ